MFYKNKNKAFKIPNSKKTNIVSIISSELNVIGNIISEGNVDFDGTLNGNIRCSTLTIRMNGQVKGEIAADTVLVYGTVKGLIRAKSVQLFSGCNVEGIIMHELIFVEDGAIVDGKFKRTDRLQIAEEPPENVPFAFDETEPSDTPILENIRLIR